MDVERVNAELKAAKVGVRIEVRGGRLSLRGTFPPKPGRSKPSQQRISLGVYANKEGIKYARAEALRVGGLLASKQFRWEEFLEDKEEEEDNSFRYWVGKFEEHYFSVRRRDRQTQSTWDTDYAYVFSKLPLDKEINPQDILRLVHSTEPDTKQRRRFCITLQALSRFAQLDLNLNQYKGNYSPTRVQRRELPSDELILSCLDLINNEKWRIAYILIAAYGLRPSEIVYLDRRELPKLRILEGKTGSRITYPIPLAWLELVDGQGELPQLSGASNKQIGGEVSRYFRRRNLPFTPYDLRHAWAVRAIKYNVPTSVAAKWMGHSVSAHTQTYEKWMGEKMHEEVFNKYIQDVDT